MHGFMAWLQGFRSRAWLQGFGEAYRRAGAARKPRASCSSDTHQCALKLEIAQTGWHQCRRVDVARDSAHIMAAGLSFAAGSRNNCAQQCEAQHPSLSARQVCVLQLQACPYQVGAEVLIDPCEVCFTQDSFRGASGNAVRVDDRVCVCLSMGQRSVAADACAGRGARLGRAGDLKIGM